MPKDALNTKGVGTTKPAAQEEDDSTDEQGAFDWGAAAEAAKPLDEGTYTFQGFSFKRGKSQAGKDKFVVGLAPLANGEPDNDKVIFLHLQPRDTYTLLTTGFKVDPTGALDSTIYDAIRESRIQGELTYGEPDKKGVRWPRVNRYEPSK